MNYPTFPSHTKFNKTMNPEQFNQVIEAILAGKYSWACVLILRFAGYNPLQYIPYRTYNRLTKENCQVGRRGGNKMDSINTDGEVGAIGTDGQPTQKCLSTIADLAYLEEVDEKHVRAGSSNLHEYLGSFNREDILHNFEFIQPKNQWFSFLNSQLFESHQKPI